MIHNLSYSRYVEMELGKEGKVIHQIPTQSGLCFARHSPGLPFGSQLVM